MSSSSSSTITSSLLLVASPPPSSKLFKSTSNNDSLPDSLLLFLSNNGSVKSVSVYLPLMLFCVSVLSSFSESDDELPQYPHDNFFLRLVFYNQHQICLHQTQNRIKNLYLFLT